MKKIIITMAALLQLIMVGQLKAQIDPHFSQYYAYPLWLNPALTGVMNGEARVNANFKDQYATIPNSYQTAAISADFRPTDKVGLGINILDQSAGSVGYNYLAAYGSFGYGIAISDDGNQQLHFGVQAGLINRSFDASKLQLGDQFNPGSGFDPNLPNFENFSSTNATIFDAGAGIFYYDGNPTDVANPFLGVSVGHLTQPKDPFAVEGINAKLPMRYTVHGGIRLTINEDLDLIPHAIYIKQQQAQEKDLGLYSEIKLPSDNGLIMGVMYRFNDAAIANVGYHFDNYIVGASYDFNTSQLSSATSGQGGFELSISYVFHKRIQGPEPICPRL
ncbi:type IX secretion system membrane protein, PorP/SprF family [Mucilaginibacter mallensis]|uniref:Type IX secretion system membrane protein, PorP/SprF family n=1 Tax=Mucilaginibacter mallensis TaxID=652787 RepID=A0A1H2CH07_MUCMA|nr:PorP/SprF family type IX secretion system membrane protein [Mucilaginibacter mallensis]SDT69795.1 type IX secretion system membrane protein, PorP/SprF family [Mucilaginibacter mallensis]